jgi:LMBR1 domain-containing protein 1
MALLVLYFFSSSVAGIAAIGIRFLWVRLFELRKGRNSPQALLVATVMLTLIMLAVNYAIAMIVAPQYAIYGAQTFCTNPTKHPDDQPDCSVHEDLIVPCSELSEEYGSKNVCTPSVVSTFLNRVTINFPFFGALAFWAQFAFLAVFLIVFVTTLFRTPKLNLSELDEDAEEDEEEGLLASTGRRFGASWQDIRGQVKKPTTGAAQEGVRGIVSNN